MKSSILIPALVAFVGVAVCMPVTAQTTNAATATAPAMAPSTKKAAKASKTEYKGSIVAMDASSITVENKSTKMVVMIAPTTKIYKDKVPAAITDFAVGDKVTGSYTKDANNVMTAATLRKKTMMAKTPAPTPAAPAASGTNAAQ